MTARDVNILLVDDRPDNLVALEAVLEPLGHRLVRATSGEDALKHLLAEDFSVILLDVQMPGMDGFQTAKQIKQRERTRDVPIIFLTAISREPGHALRGYSTGAVDYIAKPFDPDALRAKVSVFVELHLKNELLKKQGQELERSNEELQQFAYIASHDLREPLRVISGYLALLQEDLGGEMGEDIAMYVRGAMSSAERMQSLIDDLLTYSRVGAGKPEYVPVDLNAVVDETLENLGQAIRDAGAELDIGALPTIVGDSSQICQLFQNLLSNAIKFQGPTPPRIQIAAQLENSRCIVSVTDNGMGFDPKDSGRVFEIFQRVHPTSEIAGTGIGLAICKKIVDQHGGRIWVESEPGKGTTFSFSLPVSVQERV
jgi:two-component system sensor histidine kinase/response regulator